MGKDFNYALGSKRLMLRDMLVEALKSTIITTTELV